MFKKIIVSLCLSLLFVGWARPQDGGLRIGVFDSQPVWQETNEGKKMQANLAAFRDNKMAEISARENELNQLRQKLRDQEMSLTDEKKAQMLKNIDQKSIDLKRLNDDATREMKSQLGDAQDQFQKELFQVVEALGKEKSYSLILERTIVVYSAQTLDITHEVVAKFNELFGASGAPAAKANTESAPPGN